MAGCWLLVELGAGWLALLFFVSLNWLWPGWGDFTAGYYCLMIEPQGDALGFAALASLLKAFRTKDGRWLAMALTCAAGVDLANAWVLPAVALFTAAIPWETLRGTALLRRLIFGFTAVVLMLLAYNYAAFQKTDFLGPTVGNTSGPVQLFCSLVSGTGGVVLNAFLPVQAGSFNTGGIVLALEVAALIGTFFLGRYFAAGATLMDLRLLLALIAVMLGQVAMVVLARRPDFAGFYWPAKWTAMAHCTFVLFLAFALDRHLRNAPSVRAHRFQQVAIVCLFGLWIAGVTPTLLDAMGAPVSRANNVRQAIARRDEFLLFSKDIQRLAASFSQRPVLLPSFRDERFFAVYPRLEGYGLRHVASALPRGLVQIEPEQRPLSTPMQKALVAIPNLQRLYPDVVP